MIETWIARLGAAELWERLLAEDALRHTDATAALIALLDDATQPLEARWRALFLLGERGGAAAIEVLSRARHDESIDVRQSAVWALGLAAEPRTFEALSAVFADPNEEEQLRFVTASTLAQLDRQRTLPLLHAALDGTQDAQRRAARAVLANLAEREGLGG